MMAKPALWKPREERMTRAEEIRMAWETQTECFPDYLNENSKIFLKIDARQKKDNETLVEEFLKRMQKKIQPRPKNPDARRQWEKKLEQELQPDIIEFLGREKILSLTEWMGPELLDAFKRETKHFIDKAREFDESLNQAQIWQAMRNYFIYAMIVEMQGEEQNAKDPILAYSLLYPYTDDYIDDKQVSAEDKKRYNRMIASRLNGEMVTPNNLLEEKTCRLLDMILNSYDGEKQRRIRGTLLELLEAQSKSISQQKKDITDSEILDISIRKGSASVLADYLFAASEWAMDEEIFYLKFGFLLQLVDDLQDIEEDRENGSHTLMTRAEEQKRLEQCVNHLLWFSWNVIRQFQPKNPGIKNFVLKYCVEITLLSAAMNQQWFSREYIMALEAYLPFSLEFIQRMKKQQRKGLKTKGV